jgi:hypothetical protein
VRYGAVVAGKEGYKLGGCGMVMWWHVRRGLSWEDAARCCGGREEGAKLGICRKVPWWQVRRG